VFCYINWSRHIGTNQPFYGLQDPKIYSDGDPYTPLEVMAAKYIKAIKEVQAEGPYLLGGWSFGGHVAFEMARQLREMGEGVGLLAIIDTGAVTLLEKKYAAADDATLLATVAAESARSADQGLNQLIQDLRHLDYHDQLERTLKFIFPQRSALPQYAFTYLRRSLDLFKTRVRVLRDYKPALYDGRITLIRATERHDSEIPDQATDAEGNLNRKGI
jgi:thioesterase domain-containing protein